MERVSAVHKFFGKTDPSNFRPIHILPTPRKCFERIVHDQVFTTESDFLNDKTSGFRKLFSTTTAVLDFSKNNYVGDVAINKLKKSF